MKIALILVNLLLYSFISIAQQSSSSELEKDFHNKKLTPENIDAFEKRSKQKIIDFSDYFQIISNKNIDKQLLEHSKASVINLFSSSDCTIADSLINIGIKDVSLNQYFEKLQATKYHSIIGTANDINFIDRLTETKEGNYSGSISYIQILRCYNAKGELIVTSEEKKIVEVVLSQNTVKFGNTEKTIWGIKLCDIKKAQ